MVDAVWMVIQIDLLILQLMAVVPFDPAIDVVVSDYALAFLFRSLDYLEYAENLMNFHLCLYIVHFVLVALKYFNTLHK